MNRPIYRRDGWILCICQSCGHLNYVEPHGTTAYCKYEQKETEHNNIPYEYRNMSGTHLIRSIPRSTK